jgi:peptidoglycan hydrolase-like protein with peptidoglycan-binding domain
MDQDWIVGWRTPVAVAVCCLFVAASATSPAVAAPTCHLAGSWSQTTEQVGSTTWSITADGRAQESGLGNASGTATLSGGVLTITWTTTNGYAGVYRWTLNTQCGGTGTLKFDKTAPGDTRQGKSFASTVTGPPPEDTDAVPSAGVRRLQSDLRRLGLYSGPLDGNESPRLITAVKNFQKRVGIRIDGRCDDERCRSALKKALGLDDPKRPPGATPKAPRTVTELQRDLRKLGFYSGPLDGRYDAAVRTAVKRFQHDAGIPVDGTCTSRCQLAIVKALTRRAASRSASATQAGRKPLNRAAF